MSEKNPRSKTTERDGISEPDWCHSTRTHGQSKARRSYIADGYSVVFSASWIVRGAETGQDAINIAVSEVGGRVASAGGPIRNIDISVQQIGCHSCGTGSEALLLVSETALVGLFLEVVVDAEDPDTAEKIARREVGPHLDNTPLASVDIAPAD